MFIHQLNIDAMQPLYTVCLDKLLFNMNIYKNVFIKLCIFKLNINIQHISKFVSNLNIF